MTVAEDGHTDEQTDEDKGQNMANDDSKDENEKLLENGGKDRGESWAYERRQK